MSFEIATSVGWEEYWYARIDDDSSKLQHVYIIKKNNNRIFLIKRDCRDQRMENRKSRHQKIVLVQIHSPCPSLDMDDKK